MVKKLTYFIPVLYMILIWTLSSFPADAVVDTNLSIDSLIKESLHLVEFGILYLFWVVALVANNKFNAKTNIIFAAISILYGLSDEIHQSFVPARSASVFDFIKDTIGVVVAYYFVKKKLLNKGSVKRGL